MLTFSNRVDETGTVTYIVKPSGGTQGKGIYLVQSPKEYCKEQMNGRGNGPQNDNEAAMDPSICLGADSMGYLAAKEVVQQYEDTPVLVSGFKADLRIYVVLESIKPLRIHVYRDGLVRLASQRYHTPDAVNMRNSKMHLTNYSINKFPDSVDPETSSQLEATAIGSTKTSVKGGSHSDAECLNSPCVETKTNWQCKRRLHHFIQSGRFETRSNLTPTTFWPKVDELVRNTVFALVPYLRVAYWAECGGCGITDSGSVKSKDPPQCFQIFGFDLLLVEPDCRPVLLEVNSSPSLRIDCMRPLVRYPSVAARQGLSPDIVVNSPKYSAFFRSRVDEAVKLGLLKATLLLMGSRIIHQRLLRYSPEKAKAFLEACGYKSAFSRAVEKDRKSTTDAPKRQSKVDEFLSSSMLQTHSVRAPQRGSMGCSSSNRWMSARISQIYCRPRAREQRWNERKKKHQSASLMPVKSSATMPTTSTAVVTVAKTSAVNTPSIPALTAPVWPPLRCPSIHTGSGRQRQSEKLSEHFLSQPLSRACRKARNRLHCIYAEDEIYPTSTGIFAENERECGVNVSHNEKVQFPQSFPTFNPTKMRKASPMNSEAMEKMSLDEKQPPQGDSNSNDSGVREYSQPSPCTMNSVAHLRMVDRLAEIFIHILSIRRPQCSHQRPPETVDDVAPRSHISRSRPTNNLSFVIYLDPNGKTVSSHLTTTNNGTNEAQAIVEVPIPRMDFTSFRMFTQRCKLRSAGVSIREVDVLYMKHRLHWFRVFEPDSPSADTVVLAYNGKKNVLGISFPAFVELCSVIAQKYFAHPFSFGDSCDSARGEEDQGEPTSEGRKKAFMAFVAHCSSALNMPSIQSPSPRPATATPKSLH
ncbi:Tubulin polyglutamylase TTLL11 [Taenia crassiceps]|uniref:Tubulin polyglutamylase TTLL11 n=1 Tax=Taenia crassiceps TaxID=6207 RepID=A0ABR4Q5E3_9CEST